MDVLVDDCSPQIAYTSSVSGWIVDHRAESGSSIGSYLGSTFHSTYTEGDQMKFVFNGSGISVYGAKRDDHGVFGVKIDDGDEALVDTYAGTNLFQQELWSQSNLSTGREHTLTITNYPSQRSNTTSSVTQWWIDIDYLVFTQPVSAASLYTTTIDDTSSAVTYDSSWAPYGNGSGSFYNRTDHASTTSNSVMELKFNGSSVQLFSTLGVDKGQYSVSLDGQPAEGFSATFSQSTYQVPLYTVSGLDDAAHTVRLINLGSGTMSTLDFDYAIVNSTHDHSNDAATGTTQSTAYVSSSPNLSPSSTSSTPPSPIAAIAGGAAGGAVGLVLVIALAWFLFFRRRQPSARPPSRVDSYYYPSSRSGSSTHGPSPYPPSRHGQVDLVSDKEAGSGGGSGASDTRSEWSSNSLQTPLTNGMDNPRRLERGESQPFLLAVPAPPRSTAPSYAIHGPPPAPSTASVFALDGPSPAPTTYTATPSPSEAGSSRSRAPRAPLPPYPPLPHTPPRWLPVTASPPSGDADPPLSSREAAYKAELVRLPFTATPPRVAPGPGLGRQDDSTDALADLSLSLRGKRMEVPGRAIDMGPLPLSLPVPVYGHHGRDGDPPGEENVPRRDSSGTLPPDYVWASAERADHGRA